MGQVVLHVPIIITLLMKVALAGNALLAVILAPHPLAALSAHRAKVSMGVLVWIAKLDTTPTGQQPALNAHLTAKPAVMPIPAALVQFGTALSAEVAQLAPLVNILMGVVLAVIAHQTVIAAMMGVPAAYARSCTNPAVVIV